MARDDVDFGLLLAAVLVAAAGMGATLPYLQIYVHEVRGYDLQLTALASSGLALAAFPVILLSGPAADRWGPGRVLVAGAVLAGAGGLAMSVASAPWVLIAAAIGLGAGMGTQLPMIGHVVAGLAPRRGLAWAFSVEYLVLNAGLAGGAVAGGALVASGRLEMFQVVYLFLAACFAAMAGLLCCMRDRSSAGAAPAAPPRGDGYLSMLGDVPFLLAGAVILLVVTAGYGQQQSALPLYLSSAGHLSTALIGLAFATNTVCVLCLQMPVRRVLGHLPAARILVLLGPVWAAAWLVLVVPALPGAGLGAAAVTAAVGMGIMAAGETLYATSALPLVNQIAPERLRGRYNAGAALCWQAGMVLGPLLGDVALAPGRTGIYPLLGLALSLLAVPFAAVLSSSAT